MKYSDVDSEQQMSFREKIAWLSLGGVLIAFGPYFLSLVFLGAAPWPPSPAGAAQMMLATAVLVVVMTIGAIGVALSNVREAEQPSDERDRGIARRATAIAYPVLITAIFLALGSLFFSANPAVLINAVLAAVVLAETLRCGLEIIGYRRGW